MFSPLILSQTTNYRLSQTERWQATFLSFMKMVKCSPKGFKTLWEMEKSLQVISPFPSVFKRFVQQTHENQGLFGKG